MAPLVSCIVPTKNRAATIRLAIAAYQSQTYSDRELVILDNGDDETPSLVPDQPDIRYLRVEGNKKTGEMRNLCCEEARGEIICHFDSDDWSAPGRVWDQVSNLHFSMLVTGYRQLLLADFRDKTAYQWFDPSSAMVVGTSLCYYKWWWKEQPFKASQVGEDSAFWNAASRKHRNRVHATHGERQMVALIHDGQTSTKQVSKNSKYARIPFMSLPKEFHAHAVQCCL